MTGTTPTPFTVTRLGDMLIARDGHPGHDGYGWQDSYADENIEREVRGHQAILDHRAQERQAKAAEEEERKAGVEALLTEIVPDHAAWAAAVRVGARTVVQALYDKGHRADPDPELTALRLEFPKGTRVDVAENVTFITGAPQRHLADTTVTVHEVARSGTDLLVSVVDRLGDGRTWVLPQYLSEATPEEQP